MSMKIAVINLVLSVLLVTAILLTFGVWRSEQALPARGTPAAHEDAKVMRGATLKPHTPPSSAYDGIVARNLFSAERAEHVPEPEEEAVVVENRIQGKSISLFGVVMRGDYAKALISNPERKAGERPEIWVRAGDQLANLKVTDISHDSIVFQDGGQKYKILMHDKDKPRTRTAAEKDEKANIIVTEPTQPKQEPKQVRTGVAPKNGADTITTPFGVMQRRKK